MNHSAPLRWARRCWPQKIRTRLALLYAALFFAAGSALLGLTYGLVASSLPHGSAALPASTKNQLAKLSAACKHPNPDPGTQARCNQVANEIQKAGAQSGQQQTLHSLLLYSLAGLGAMTVVSGALGWLVSGRALRPVRVITEAAQRASERNLSERLAMGGPADELTELADTFDGMLDRLDRAFAAQRRFVGNASHELRTPLTMMRTAIDVTLAKPGRTAQHLEDMAVRVRRSIDRAETMIDALLALALSDRGLDGAEPVDLATVAEDALDASQPAIARLALQVEAQLDPAEISGDRQLLERMVHNLVDNAIRHNEPSGWIRLRTAAAAPGGCLHIANSGPFVPDDAVPGLFEPFRRMAARTGSRDGVGLGLSIASSVAAAHGGRVAARSQRGGGLDITVALPGRPVALPGRKGPDGS